MSPPSPRIAAVILAAGLSQRMGQFKPLLPFGDRPMIARAIENYAARTDIAPILVVTGHEAPAIRTALAACPGQFIHNPNYPSGMLSSVQAGLAALPQDLDFFFIALGDQPAVHPATLARLIAAAAANRLTIPTFGHKHGHPVLFPRALRPEILALPSDQTLKTMVHRHLDTALECPVDDPFVLMDVDTPEDYRRALELWQEENSGPSAVGSGQ